MSCFCNLLVKYKKADNVKIMYMLESCRNAVAFKGKDTKRMVKKKEKVLDLKISFEEIKINKANTVYRKKESEYIKRLLSPKSK